MFKVQIQNKKVVMKLAIFVFLLLNSTLAFSQVRVSGAVASTLGEPLIGVSVLEKGTTNGTITDLDGNFNLTVSSGAVLQFSYVGFITQEVDASSSFMKIELKEDQQLLEEVVVVGYGKMTRKDVTSSITSVKAEDLNKGGVFSSPGELLQGKVPGLSITTSNDPNANPSLTLRGSSSFREGAAQEPYYVIDGIPGASLSMVAPDDIESIDVLRDASATAIYGSKAANGVIIVTTKKGKSGTASVTYNGYLAIDQVSKRWDVMNASEHRKYLSDNGLTIHSSDYINDNTDTNWQDEVQRVGVSHNHNVSISGGSDMTTYSISLNYMDNKGVIKKNGMDRLVGRALVNTTTLNDRLDLGFNLNVSIENSTYYPKEERGLNVLDAMTYYLPESPIYNEDGTFFENLNRTQYFNPVALLEQNSDDVRRKGIQGVAKGTLHIIPEILTLDAHMSYQSDTENISRYNDIDSKINHNSGGYALRSTVENIQKNLEVYGNFNNTFNNAHKVGAMIGYSWQENSNDNGFQTMAKEFTSDALGYHGLAMGGYTGVMDYGNFYYSKLRTISFFGRANYSYNSKYLLQATLRYDGSSAFGDNNRWGTFPSFSAAWRASEESFVKQWNIFSDLKFRVGYGVSGNTLGFDPFIAKRLYGKTGVFVNSQGNIVSSIGTTRNSNENLKWERTGMFNVGIDFGFFNNRLTGSIEYYDKRTTDLIADYAVSATDYPTNILTANVGEISNKGIELLINVTPVITKDFTWSTSVNLSHNKNEVVSISNEEFSVDYFDEANLEAAGQSGMRQQRIEAGRPLGSFYTWKWAGYSENGVSLFYTKDGETTTTPSKEDRFWTGSAQPKLNFGWNNTLTYKNWAMTVFFTGVTGNKILNASRASLSRMAGITERNVLKSVVKTEKITDTNSNYLSDRYIEKGDYLRLSNLSISYTFDNFSSYIKNLRVYASCNNVFVITGYKGLDPEVNLGGLTPGIDNKNFYPKTRTFMFGASLTF
ncbi:MAG: TonB-dependent receptor [Bacteroidales bacterium]|nr:TonB-dependent receptor [Bacteroidales bacterium]